LAKKDTPRKRERGKSDRDTSSESDVDGAAQVEELKKKKGNSSAQGRTTRLWSARWQRKTPRRKLNWLSWQAFTIHTR
jgi:hypothetical protein